MKKIWLISAIIGAVIILSAVLLIWKKAQVATEFNPTAKILCESAVSYMEDGNYKAAIENLKKSIILDPKHPKSEYALAVCYLRMEPPDLILAKQHYEKSKKLGYHPPDWFLRHLSKLEGQK